MFPSQEWRKRNIHMTKWELLRINEIIHNNSFKFNIYSSKRLEERNISEIDVYRALKYGEIIEFHYKDKSPRVLVRSKEIVKGESICVVVDLALKTVITVYKNDFEDKHYTLHKELYTSNKDLMRYLNIKE